MFLRTGQTSRQRYIGGMQDLSIQWQTCRHATVQFLGASPLRVECSRELWRWPGYPLDINNLALAGLKLPDDVMHGLPDE